MAHGGVSIDDVKLVVLKSRRHGVPSTLCFPVDHAFVIDEDVLHVLHSRLQIRPMVTLLGVLAGILVMLLDAAV